MLHSKAPKPKSRNARQTYKITYFYADACNYKCWGEFVVLGELSLGDLQPHLFDSEFFIPERIGVPSLLPGIRTEHDHYLHRFVEAKPTDAAPYVCTAGELIERCRRASAEDWFRGMQWI